MVPGGYESVLENYIDGATLLAMEVSDFVDLKILPFGLAENFVRVIRTFVEDTYRGPPRNWDGSPVDLAVHASLLRLVDVSPPSYFEAEIFLSLSWPDSRISANCASVMETEVDYKRPCTVFWKPRITFPNALLGDDEPQVVDDHGTTFLVGEDGPADESKANPGLPRSFGNTVFQLRAKFMVLMDYKRYPYDQQKFEILVQCADASADVIRLRSTKSVAIAEGHGHPVWDVIRLDSSDGIKGIFPPLEQQTLQKIEAAGFTDHAVAFYSQQGLIGPDAREVPALSFSYSQFDIHVERYCGYYLGNYIMLESVLVLLGWCPFFMSPESIDARLGIALTLVLAINVFQILLVENLPETGYLTDLTLFTICNTTLLALIAIESVLVCMAFKQVLFQDQIKATIKKHANNKDSCIAAMCIQSYSRGHLVRSKGRTVGANGIHLVWSKGRTDGAHGTDTRWSNTVGRTKTCPRATLRSLVHFERRVISCFGRHSRFLAFEVDRLCALLVFPTAFITYSCVIFLRPGSASSCS